MACSILLLIVSTVYEKSGTFVTGCKNYKKDTIIMLEAPNVLHYDPMPAIHMWGYSTTQRRTKTDKTVIMSESSNIIHNLMTSLTLFVDSDDIQESHASVNPLVKKSPSFADENDYDSDECYADEINEDYQYVPIHVLLNKLLD